MEMLGSVLTLARVANDLASLHLLTGPDRDPAQVTEPVGVTALDLQA
jgi:hypothetical protein